MPVAPPSPDALALVPEDDVRERLEVLVETAEQSGCDCTACKFLRAVKGADASRGRRLR